MADMKLIKEIPVLLRAAARLENENWSFRDYFKFRLGMSNDDLDKMVHETSEAVWKRIDCKVCGHCCRTLQIAVDLADITRLAKSLGISVAEFRSQYVQREGSREEYFASVPCPFLEGSVCTVYEDRPKSCRDFPYLQEPHFRTRSISFIQNCSVCPIVFNTSEQLKVDTGFRKPTAQTPKHLNKRGPHRGKG